MRCFLVTASIPDTGVAAQRLAATNALAKTTRDELMAAHGLKKKDVIIEQHEVPLAKQQLLGYLNELYAAQDLGETEGDE